MKILMTHLKKCLREHADINFQRRAWFAGDGTEISSFDELISQLFDETGLSDVIDDPSLQDIVGKAAAARLRDLDRAVSEVDSDLPLAEFILLPEMARIRELAQQALEELD